MAAGLVYITTITASGDTSVSADNVFTTTYDYYVVILGGGFGNNTKMRLRVSGADATGSNYGLIGPLANNTSLGNTQVMSDNYWYVGFSTEYGYMHQVSFPATAVPTTREGLVPYNASDPRMGANVGVYDQNTAFDGFTVFVDSGTMTGTIDVYGMVQ